MFTGLVEGCGRVRDITPDGPGVRLVITPPDELAGPQPLGASIAINGCCLTVVASDDDAWEFEAGSETLSKTNLGRLVTGDRVNLERSLAVGARLGGHFVQGHVDGCGTVAEIITEGDWVFMHFSAAEDLTRLMVPKGSICVDGVSLTLVTVTDDRFSVALIPHTLDVTTLGVRGVGDPVNLETDILGKYVQKLLAGRDSAGDPFGDLSHLPRADDS